MACGGCARKRVTKQQQTDAINKTGDEVKGGYKYLTDRQLRARLEIYKKKYCSNCVNRYKCDYAFYVKCKDIKTSN